MRELGLVHQHKQATPCAKQPPRLRHTTNSQDVGVNSGVVGNRGEEGVWAQIASLFSADTNGRSLAIQHSLFFQREA